MKTLKYYSILFFTIILFSCGSKQVANDPNIYFTCSMHQQIHENKPGKCPICFMDLTKVTIDPKQKNKIVLSETQIQLANIVIDTLKTGKISEEIQLHAKITINENNVKTINSRISGRIDKLYFKNSGDVIKTGDLLYELFSNELLSAQKDYLIAKDRLKANGNNADYAQIVNSAKNKLLLWGLTENQIEKLQSINDLKNTVSIYSKMSGTIQEISINEGDYVNEGTTVFKIVDLSTLWIEAQVFSNETDYVNENKAVDFVVSAFPNEKLHGKISFVSPELQNESKISIARIEIDNPANKYQSGMLAIINVQTQEKKGLVLPLNAVLQSGKGAKVWIQNIDKNFEIRLVTIGIQNSEFVEILSGLKEFEKVVVSGAYLLNSEFVLKNGSEPI